MKELSEREQLKAALKDIGFGHQRIAEVMFDASKSKSVSVRLRAAENAAKILGAMPSNETRVNVSRTDQRMLVLGGAQSATEERISEVLAAISNPAERRRAAELLKGESEKVIDTESANGDDTHDHV